MNKKRSARETKKRLEERKERRQKLYEEEKNRLTVSLFSSVERKFPFNFNNVHDRCKCEASFLC